MVGICQSISGICTYNSVLFSLVIDKPACLPKPVLSVPVVVCKAKEPNAVLLLAALADNTAYPTAVVLHHHQFHLRQALPQMY